MDRRLEEGQATERPSYRKNHGVWTVLLTAFISVLIVASTRVEIVNGATNRGEAKSKYCEIPKTYIELRRQGGAGIPKVEPSYTEAYWASKEEGYRRASEFQNQARELTDKHQTQTKRKALSTDKKAKRRRKKGTMSSTYGLSIEKRIRVSNATWSIQVANLGKPSIIIGQMDGYLKAIDFSGNTLWENNTGGLIYQIAVGDVDNDGRDEVACTSLNPQGSLLLFDDGGKKLWEYSEAFPFEAVGMGDINGDKRAEIVTGTAAFSLQAFTPKGKLVWKRNVTDEKRVSSVVIGRLGQRNENSIVYALSTSPINSRAITSRGKTLWESTEAPGWQVDIGDLNNDGQNEVVITGGGVALFFKGPESIIAVDGDRGRTIWKHKSEGPLNLVKIGEVAEKKGREVVSLSREGTIEVLDARGNRLFGYQPRGQGKGVYKNTFYANLLPLCFTLSKVQTDGYQRIIFGTGLRNKEILITKLVKRNVNDLATIREPNSLDHLREIRNRVDLKEVSPKQAQKKNYFISFDRGISRKNAERVIQGFKSIFEKLPRNNIEYSAQFRVNEIRKRHKTSKGLTSEGILRIASLCERKQVPFWLLFAKGRHQGLSKQTIRNVFDIAPQYARGLYLYESFPQFNDNWRFQRETLKPILDLCRKYGKKFQIQERWDAWGHWPSHKNFFDVVFSPEYKDVVIPVLKTNNAKAHDISLSGLVGLWKAGLVKDWGISTLHDMWNFDNDWLNHTLITSDVLLRTELVGASLGASYFRIEVPHYYLDVKSRSVTEPAKYGRGLVHALLAKKIINRINPEQLVTNPVCIKRFPSSSYTKEYASGKYKGNALRFLPQQLRGDFFGFNLAMQTYPENNFGRLVYQTQRASDGTIFETPYGIVPIYPKYVGDSTLRKYHKTIWGSDSEGLWIADGKKHTVIQSKEKFLRSVSKGSAELPVTAEHVFTAIHRFKDYFLVIMIDPNLFQPRDIKTQLKINKKIHVKNIYDMLYEKELKPTAGTLPIVIPRGTFRILKIYTGERP